MPKVRRVPMRTCVACGQPRPKRELFRVVRTPEGEVVFDPTGKRNGRGAYLCGEDACMKKAMARLGRALEAEVPGEVLEHVRQARERAG